MICHFLLWNTLFKTPKHVLFNLKLTAKIHYLVEPKKSQIPQHSKGTDTRTSGDLPSHLQTNLDNFKWIRENHLGASSLGEGKHTYIRVRL